MPTQCRSSAEVVVEVVRAEQRPHRESSGRCGNTRVDTIKVICGCTWYHRVGEVGGASQGWGLPEDSRRKGEDGAARGHPGGDEAPEKPVERRAREGAPKLEESRGGDSPPQSRGGDSPSRKPKNGRGRTLPARRPDQGRELPIPDQMPPNCTQRGASRKAAGERTSERGRKLPNPRTR